MAVPKTKKQIESKNARIRNAVRHHYYKRMPEKKWHRVVIWVVFLLLVVIVAAQMLYPPNKSLPFASVAGTPAGWKDHDSLAKLITDKFMNTRVTVQADKTARAEYTLAVAGADPKTEVMINAAADYPFWLRFIPLSALMYHPSVDTLDADFNKGVLKKLSTTASEKLSHTPINAGLTIKNGILEATDDTSGSIVNPAAVEQAILEANLKLGQKNTIDVSAQRKQAAITTEDFAAIKVRAEMALEKKALIHINDKTFTPSKADIAAWLTITVSENNQPTLGVDDKKIEAYLKELDKKVGTQAGETIVAIVDGREEVRSRGATGRAIKTEPLIQALDQWLLSSGGSGEFYGELIDVAPRVVSTSQYTSSEAGLRAFVNDTARNQNANIVIQQLDGSGWSANADGELSTVSASTYKLFVALMLFEKMNQGKIHWNDAMLDTTVSGCFDRMTIASTNPCAEKWLNDWGRSNMNAFVRSKGFSGGTDFMNTEATHTTANDLTKFMIGLEKGSLIGGVQRERLLHSLSTHPYRAGIPTGSKGQVWDKVGFLWDYTHDTAIVHHPKGTYVMTIMTKGRSYATIAEITRQAERIMYP